MHMRSALIELTSIAEPLNRFAHWVAQRASNESRATATRIDSPPLQLLVRPRLGKVRRLATSASNSDRLGLPSSSAALQLASRNDSAASAASAGALSLVREPHQQASISMGVRPSLRVVVKSDGSGAGRMVISGRMADVCAELDRLARQERQTRHMQPCA